MVDTDTVKPGARTATGRILFLGDFTYPPNREGLTWLLEAVMPVVWEQRPDLRLVLAGRGLDPAPADERVEPHGYVDDLDALYATVDTVLVPLRTVGGSQLKFIEALARGHAGRWRPPSRPRGSRTAWPARTSSPRRTPRGSPRRSSSWPPILDVPRRSAPPAALLAQDAYSIDALTELLCA